MNQIDKTKEITEAKKLLDAFDLKRSQLNALTNTMRLPVVSDIDFMDKEKREKMYSPIISESMFDSAFQQFKTIMNELHVTEN